MIKPIISISQRYSYYFLPCELSNKDAVVMMARQRDNRCITTGKKHRSVTVGQDICTGIFLAQKRKSPLREAVISVPNINR
ncbi:MAG TPA: hypothetical protein VFG46_26705 [Chryseolinea sp.]|nr:hypothetical protein [Chryseolinea sp.]